MNWLLSSLLICSACNAQPVSNLTTGLVFYLGRDTSGPSAQMQADIDRLTAWAGLSANNYRLTWADLSAWPSYQ